MSIITPCLDPGEWLERCIASVRAQTYPNIEHIVIDGGSTDGTRARLEELDGVRWVSEPDSGQSDAINKGFAMANGEILGWLNADDEFLPDAIERVVGCFMVDPSVGWSYGDCELVYQDKKQLWRSPERLDEDSFDWQMPLPQQGWFLSRWALDRVGPLDESFDLAMDFDLCIRLQVAAIRSCRAPATLARFLIHPGSKTGQRNYSEFIHEGARALLKAGRIVPSYAALGQACTYSLQVDGQVSRRSLQERIGSVRVAHGKRAAAAVRAGAFAAAAQIESKGSPKPLVALRWLLSPVVWRFTLTRRLIPEIVKTSLARRAERSAIGPVLARLRARR